MEWFPRGKSFTEIFNENLREDNCINDYWSLEHDEPTFKTVALTMLVIFLTITLESSVHLEMRKKTVSAKKPTEATSPSDAESSASPTRDLNQESGNGNIVEGTVKKKKYWCNPDPSPSVRANRLVCATFLIVPICVAFGFRMADVHPDPGVRHECLQYLSNIYPNWWAISILNILPFIIACFAWLRAFSDCLLVRCGKGLGYTFDFEDETSENKYFWPVGGPITIIVLFVTGCIVAVVRRVAVCLMGRPDMESHEGRAQDIEMQNEESRRLVDDIDGQNEEGEQGEADVSDGPPAYEAVCSPEGLTEGKA